MILYFAYGTNMDPVHMAEYCPGAERIGVATLPNYAFGIAAGGYGTVRPKSGQTVLGVLWRLTPAEVAALDRFEGVPDGFYRRDSASVATPEGQVVEAMIYRPTDDRPGKPAPRYLERIIEVAGMLKFPAAYLAQLENLARIEDLLT